MGGEVLPPLLGTGSRLVKWVFILYMLEKFSIGKHLDPGSFFFQELVNYRSYFLKLLGRFMDCFILLGLAVCGFPGISPFLLSCQISDTRDNLCPAPFILSVAMCALSFYPVR